MNQKQMAIGLLTKFKNIIYFPTETWLGFTVSCLGGWEAETNTRVNTQTPDHVSIKADHFVSAFILLTFYFFVIL